MPSDSESSGRRAAAVTPEPQIAEVPVWDSSSDDEALQVGQNESTPNSTQTSGEDEFGYPLANPEKHLSIKHSGYQSVHLFAIEKSGRRNLGLALAGHRDPGQMCVFVCGIRPDGAAAADGRLKIGDELLEVNGQSLAGKSHSNAAPVIADCGSRLVKLVVGRRENPLELMAVKPLQPPHSLPCDASPHLDQQASKATSAVDQPIPPESNELLTQQELPMQSNGDALKAADAQELSAAENLPSTDLKATQPNVGKYGIEMTCTLIKGKQGLGFAIMEGSADDKPGIYVKHITEKGPAAAEGTLRTGDRLLRANEFSLAESAYDEALDRLRSMSGSVVITVVRHSPPVTEAATAAATAPAKTKRKEVRIALPPEANDDDDSRDEKQAAASPIANCQSQDDDKQPAAVVEPEVAPAADMVKEATRERRPDASAAAGEAAESSGAAANAQNSNPATCQIVAGRETVVEIDKGSSSLGLSIVGGSDTTLNAIVIHEVYDTGAAWKDRRLWAGDQILSVDDRDLSNVTHEEAKNILLQAGPRVRLRVWRDDKEITEDDLYDKLRVDLVRRQGMGLGFSIVARSNDEGVLVSDIIKGGVAENDKRLQPGDRILEINGKDMRKTPHADVATILKSSQGKVSFLIGRLKHVGVVKSKRKAAYTMHEVHLGRGTEEAGSLGIRLTAQPSHMLAAAESPEAATHQGIFVGHLEPDGPAMKSGKIRPDDELVSVNEQPVEGRTVDEASQLIAAQAASGSVLIRLRRWEEPAGRLTVRLSRGASRHGMLGFSIVGGRGTPQGDHPIYVRTVTDESAAKNLLFKGDRIDFVNGRSLDGVTHDEAVNILKSVVGEMVLVIHRPTAAGAS